MSPKLPPKRDVMMALLQQSPYVNVHLDPRIDGVVLPPQLRRQKRILLQYGLNMRIPIPDLDVGEEGIGATLSFNKVPSWTFIPWNAVFAVLSEDQRSGLVWEDDLPRDFEPESPPDQKTAPGKKGPAGAKKGSADAARRPVLRAVAGGKSSEPTETPSPKPVLTVHEAKTRDGERPERTPEEPPQLPVSEPTTPKPSTTSEPAPADEIIEPAPPPAKKKREIPPYLRVVK